MTKRKKQKIGKVDHPDTDNADKSLEMIIQDRKTKAGAYRKILDSIKLKEKKK